MPKHTLTDEMGPWVPLPESVIEMVPQIGTDAAFLMLYFRYRLNRYRDPEKTWPGYATMSKELGWGTQKISKVLKILEEHNLIIKKKRYGTSSEYTIRYPKYQLAGEDTQSFENQSTEDKSCPQSFENQNSITDSPLKIKVQSFENQRGVLNKDKTLKEEIKDIKKPRGHNAIRKALGVKFAEVTGLSLPVASTIKESKAAGALWWQPLRAIAKLTNWNQKQGVALIRVSVKRMRKGKLTISDPNSILKTARAIMGEVNSGLVSLDARSRDEKIKAESDYYAEKRRRRIHAQDMAGRMEDDEAGQSGTD